METTPRIFRTSLLLSAGVATPLLAACSNIQLSSPAANAVVNLPATTHVEITSSRSISNVNVTIDGADFSNQISYSPASGNYAGDLALTGGMHTIVASADAYCLYCTGQVHRASDTKTFCVSSGSVLTNKTIFAQVDARGWLSTSATTVANAADACDGTKWGLFPKGTGLSSIPGQIRSTKFPGSCLHSQGTTNGAVLDLAPCNINDPFQVWEGTKEGMSGNDGLYQFLNQGVGANNVGCIAEGTGAAAGQLIQSNCTGASDRLWKVRNNTLGSFETSQTPWGQ